MEEQNWIRGPIIGRGSTATVSLAITNSGEFFAVKSTEFSSSAFLQREQSVLSKLSSPYIVKYIGSDLTTENDKSMYNLLMEYVTGGSIHDLIKNSGGKLTEPEIRSFTRQILKGLVYLHEQGIVHCDLKSQNVMIGVGEEKTAKIADLGCAKMVTEENESLEFSGTPAFMSPEVARGEEQSFPADVWALGCLVIEMATGLSPWPELNDVVAAIYKIGFTDESPEIPGWLSEKGRDFLRNCLRKDPKQRWVVEELLQHPFLDEEEEDDDCLKSSSPITVLDQGFWDSYETSRFRLIQSDHEDPFVKFSNLCDSDRIKKLAGDENPGEPEWIRSDDEGWIEVRGNEIGEVEKRDEEDVENCVEATSLEGFENWIWDQEDSLFLEYSSTENNIFYFYSFDLFEEDNIILYYSYDHHLEDGFVINNNISFRDNNNNKIHFFSHITSIFFLDSLTQLIRRRFNNYTEATSDIHSSICGIKENIHF